MPGPRRRLPARAQVARLPPERQKGVENMTKTTVNHVPARSRGFNYSVLRTEAAEKVRAATDRIRERVRRTLEDILQIGSNLLKVKGVLGHGLFSKWLQAEFGWSERSAENFMSVAEHF